MPKRTLSEKTHPDSTPHFLPPSLEQHPAPVIHSVVPSSFGQLPAPTIRRPAPSLEDKKIALISEAKTLIFCFPELKSELQTPLLNLELCGKETATLQKALIDLSKAIKPIKEHIQSQNNEKKALENLKKEAKHLITHAKNLKDLKILNPKTEAELSKLRTKLNAAILPPYIPPSLIKDSFEALLAFLEAHQPASLPCKAETNEPKRSKFSL